MNPKSSVGSISSILRYVSYTLILFLCFGHSLPASQYGGMFFTDQTYGEIRAWLDGLPAHEQAGEDFAPKGSVSLLEHLHYTPKLRDQAPTGTCWIWSHTAAISIDFDQQFDGDPVIQEGFSIPFLASNAWMVGSDLYKGGHSGMVKDFYDMTGYAVPSRNSYAMWNAVWDEDQKTWVVDQSFGVRPAMWIHSGYPWHASEPNYPIEKMDLSIVKTYGTEEDPVSREQAIANIKTVLDSGHTVPLLFILPTDSDWDVFDKFWAEDDESAITSFDYARGHEWNDGGCGHWVLCVGYDDSGPTPYWIILNSHYAGTNRPNNLFRLAQDIDYSATFEKTPYTFNTIYNWVSLITTFSPRNSASQPKNAKSLAVKTSLDSKKPSDSINITAARFDTAASAIASGRLTVNYQIFTCDSTTGTWKKKGDVWQFISNAKESPQVKISVDGKKKVWSASVKKADLKRKVNLGDGIMYKFEYKTAAEDEEFTVLGDGAATYDQLPQRSSGLLKNN